MGSLTRIRGEVEARSQAGCALADGEALSDNTSRAHDFLTAPNFSNRCLQPTHSRSEELAR
jgi:hypothetical protein